MSDTPSDLDAAAARAEAALDRLQNAHDVLFETHQREMDRLYALLGAARAYRDAVRAVDGIVDAEAALLAMVDQIDVHICSGQASPQAP